MRRKKTLNHNSFTNLHIFHVMKCEHLQVGERFSLFSFISRNLFSIALCCPLYILIVGLYTNEPLESNKRTGTPLSENEQKSKFKLEKMLSYFKSNTPPPPVSSSGSTSLPCPPTDTQSPPAPP